MKQRVKLTRKQWSGLLFKGVVTFLLSLAIECGVTFAVFEWQFQSLMWPETWPLVVLYLLIALFITIKYGQDRYFNLSLQQVIKEFDDTAKNSLPKHFDLITRDKRLQAIIASMNLLIDTAQHSMAEQRATERSKDELITNVSHDLRTPLTSILGFLGLIEQNPKTSTEDMRKYVHIAYQKSKQLQGLVNDLFEYARVNSSATQLDLQKFDMIQLLEQISAEFELEAQKQNVTIEVQSDSDSIPMRADTEKLGRVFNNLVMNALKYGQDAKHIWLLAKDSKDSVEVRVVNDGAQIPKESQQHLFDRFYRVESSRSKATGGTGLGLAIAQSLVRLHGGTIGVKSDSKLTQFIITLPKNLNEE